MSVSDPRVEKLRLKCPMSLVSSTEPQHTPPKEILQERHVRHDRAELTSSLTLPAQLNARQASRLDGVMASSSCPPPAISQEACSSSLSTGPDGAASAACTSPFSHVIPMTWMLCVHVGAADAVKRLSSFNLSAALHL